MNTFSLTATLENTETSADLILSVAVSDPAPDWGHWKWPNQEVYPAW